MTYPEKFRMKAMLLYGQLKSSRRVAEKMGCSKSIINMWVRNVLIESPEEEVAKKFLKDRFPDQARCLIEHVNSKPFTTLNQIRTYIKQKTGHFFSIPIIDVRAFKNGKKNAAVR